MKKIYLLVLFLIVGMVVSQDVDVLRQAARALESGRAFADSADYGRAIAEFTKAGALRAGWHEPYYHRGRVYYITGELDKALEDFNMAITFDYDYLLAYIARGLVHSQKGNFDQALSDYNRVFELDSTNIQGRYNRAIVAFLSLKLDKAMSDIEFVFTNAEDIDEYKPLYKYRGRIHYGKGDFESSVADLTVYLDAHPDDTEALLWRVEAYQAQGMFMEALEDSERWSELTGESIDMGN